MPAVVTARAAVVAEPLESRTLLSASLVADLSPEPAVAAPFGEVNGKFLYTVSVEETVDGTGGLFAGNGTGPGQRLADLPAEFAYHRVPLAAKGLLFFTTTSDATFATDLPKELWRTDGTPQGTFRVYVASSTWNPPPHLYAVQAAAGRLYFNVRHDSESFLATSDGTVDGTVHLARLGHDYDSYGPPRADADEWRGFGVTGGDTAVYVAADGSLRATDGTAATDRLVRPADTLSASPTYFRALPGTFTPAGGRVHFFADSPTGVELWSTDGTAAGTRPTGGDVLPQDVGIWGDSAATAGGRIVFIAGVPGGTASLYAAGDGAAATAVLTLPPHPAGTVDLTTRGGLAYLTVGGDLWRSDGTAAGTVRVHQGGPQSRLSFVDTVRDRALFRSVQGDGRSVLYSTDGTAAGTKPLGGSPSGAWNGGRHAAVFAGKLYLNGPADPDSRRETALWATDGTPAGTVAVPTLFDKSHGSDVTAMVPFNNGLAVLAGGRLWSSDGTAAGTRPLGRPTDPGDPMARAWRLFAAGPQLFAAVGGALWRSNGTAGGTRLVRTFVSDIDHRTVAAAGGVVFFVVEPTIYTAAGDRVGPSPDGGLWRSDGTAAGTVRIAAITPGAPYVAGGPLVSGAGVLFTATAGENDPAVYWHAAASGPPVATRVMADADPAFGFTAAVGDPAGDGTGRWLFMATTAAHGRAVWATDGTAAGTRLLNDTPPGPANDQDIDLASAAVLNGVTLLLEKGSGFGGGRVRAVPAAGPSTTLLGDVTAIFATPTRAFLQTWSGVWVTDGTAAGTVRVFDGQIDNGTSASPGGLAGGRYYFTLFRDGAHELWQTDGTPGGAATTGVAFPRTNGLEPQRGPVVGDAWRVWFNSVDPVHGRELWKLDVAPGAPPPGPIVGDGPNAAPTAVVAPPAAASPAAPLSLDASGSSDPDGDALTYAWDLNGDNVFADASGPVVSLTLAQLRALGVVANAGTARVRVDDGHGHAAEASAAFAVALPSGPDLRGSLTAKVPAKLKGGERIAAAVKVINGGDAAVGGDADVRVRFLLSKDGAVDGKDVTVGTATAERLALAAGAAVDVRATLKVPAKAKGSGWRLLAVVDHGGRVAEADESNNVAAAAPAAGPRGGNLSVVVAAPAVWRAGRKSDVRVSVANAGPSAAKGAARVTIVLIDSGGVERRLARKSVKLSAGAGRTHRLTLGLRLPSSVPPGTYTLRAALAPLKLRDADPTDNIAEATLTVA